VGVAWLWSRMGVRVAVGAGVGVCTCQREGPYDCECGGAGGASQRDTPLRGEPHLDMLGQAVGPRAPTTVQDTLQRRVVIQPAADSAASHEHLQRTCTALAPGTLRAQHLLTAHTTPRATSEPLARAGPHSQQSTVSGQRSMVSPRNSGQLLAVTSRAPVFSTRFTASLRRISAARGRRFRSQDSGRWWPAGGPQHSCNQGYLGYLRVS
jgi:hypothetical protein